jgi:TolB-like protein
MFNWLSLRNRVERLESEVAGIRQLYDKTRAYSDSDPRSALMNARLAAEAVCAQVFEDQLGESPKGMTLQSLIQRLTQKKAMPEQILIALSTIQRYGNFGVHHQPGEVQTITPEFAQPCLQALGQVVQWYFAEYGENRDARRTPYAASRLAGRPLALWTLSALAICAAGGTAAWLLLRHRPDSSEYGRTTGQLSSSSEHKPSGKTVAVLPFECLSPDDPESAKLDGRISSLVRSRLEESGRFDMVERNRLDLVLEELELSKSKKFDKAQVARIGKLLGARRLVLGDYFHLGDSLRVNVRFVDTETGKILWSAGHVGSATDVATAADAATTAVLKRIPEGS